MRDIINFEYLEENIKNSEYVTACENNYKQFVKSVCHRVVDEGLKIVYLCGQSSSGKTTTTLRIKKYLERLGKRAHLIELDDFFLPKDKTRRNKKGEMDFETIFALDLKAIYQLKEDIDLGKEILLPQFDFKRASHSSFEIMNIQQDDIIIFEGIHSFNHRILRTFGEEKALKVFITVNTDIKLPSSSLKANDLRFIRRLKRDFLYRNANPNYTIKLWKLVRAGEKRYVDGYIKKADIFQNSFLNYEPYIFKNEALNLIRMGIETSEDKMYFKILEKKLRNFSDIESLTVPAQSILNEFI